MHKLFKSLLVLYAILVLFSYGFVDPNFPFFHASWVSKGLTDLVYRRQSVAAAIFILLLLSLFYCYKSLLGETAEREVIGIKRYMVILVALLLFSFPAFSYDLFNYIATAKVAFYYHENPYVVMPMEIANEPMLVFTRAANKLALYGPAWIAATAIPALAGFRNILVTMVSFKLFVAGSYLLLVYLLYQKTKSIRQTLWFALNPLVVIETLVSGHNDVVMMLLAVGGLLLWNRPGRAEKAGGAVLLILSVLVKGASVVLLPLLLLPRLPFERQVKLAAILLFGVFLLSPLREEMYPWYAMWWLTFVAFLPTKTHAFLYEAATWLSLGLMLRYVPWITTREYGGLTPAVRMVVMLLPISFFLLHQWKTRSWKKHSA